MPKQKDGLIYWRTSAMVIGTGIPGWVKVMVNGWDLSRGAIDVHTSEMPGVIRVGDGFFVEAAQGQDGTLVLRDWEWAVVAIDESELLHTP